MNIELTEEELGALMAALNYTKGRTLGKSWIDIDEQVYKKIEQVREKNKPKGNYRNLIDTWG